LRFVLHLLGMIAVALAIGFGLSWYALTDGRLFGAFELGPWTTWPQAGAPTADPYTRAHLARTGALQLGLSEGLQFVAASDSEGRRLDRACRYRIEGTTPLAAFWTLAPVGGSDHANITRLGAPLALRSTGIARAPDGSVIAYVSRRLSPGNWLEIAGDGPFELVLTLYDTSVFSGVGSGIESLPAIIREACA
jgi:hypothetical protein